MRSWCSEAGESIKRVTVGGRRNETMDRQRRGINGSATTTPMCKRSDESRVLMFGGRGRDAMLLEACGRCGVEEGGTDGMARVWWCLPATSVWLTLGHRTKTTPDIDIVFFEEFMILIRRI